MIRAAAVPHIRLVGGNAMQTHVAADIFPMMSGAEFDALVADIRDNGQREPIIVHDGLILDGRNRARACEQLGVEPITAEWDRKGTPEAFVVSMNLHRRHLNESQRAMIAKRLATLKHGDNQHAQICASSQNDAADLLKVSRRAVQHAGVVQAKAAPELAAAVDRGEIAVSTAAQLVDLPKARQRDIAAAGKKVAAKAAKQIRMRKPPQPISAAPKETEHDRDLRYLRETWAATCESARAAFTNEINGRI